MKRFGFTPTRKSSLRFVPRLEALEDRSCPSCTTSLAGSTLTILGDQHDNVIQITDDGSGTIQVACDQGPTQSFGVTNIVLRGRAGGDTVTYDLTGDRSGALSLDIATQQGADNVAVNLDAGLLAGADLQITVNGGNGADTLALNAQNATIAATAKLAVTLNGNNAKDVTTFDYLGNVAGQLELRSEGGNGDDTITADVTGDVATGGSLVMFLGAGDGQDSVSATYTGLLNGNLDFEAHGGLGKDAVSADPTINAGSTGSLKGLVEGNNGKDDLTLLVHDNSGTPSTLTSLDALLNTGRGQDSSQTTDNVTVI